MTPLRWEKIRFSDKAELWKLDKPDEGGTVSTFYRGRRFEDVGEQRTKVEAEEKFTDMDAALAWFEQASA